MIVTIDTSREELSSIVELRNLFLCLGSEHNEHADGRRMDRTREGEPMQRQKHGRIRERSRGSIKEARGTKKRGREGEGRRRAATKRRREESPVDGDSTKQRCLIGVGPHQVDRGPPNRVLENDMGP